MNHSVGKKKRMKRKGPVVASGKMRFTLEYLHFANTFSGGDFHYMYEPSSSHNIASGDLKKWGKDKKITDPEWTRIDGALWPICFTRQKPVVMFVKLAVTNPPRRKARKVRLWLRPKLDNREKYLKRNSVELEISVGAKESYVAIKTGGALPNEIGRYKLSFEWKMSSPSGKTIYKLLPKKTNHTIFSIYGQPYLPEYDTGTDADPGRQCSKVEGTLTGTQKRFWLLMNLVGNKKGSRSIRVYSAKGLTAFYWRLHKGINDTPGKPPYFDSKHDAHITADGTSKGTKIPYEDQWLAWVQSPSNGNSDPSKRHWNDVSCIGHVQVLKTMAASIGLFARRTWLFPHTVRLPDGSTWSHSDIDLYALGKYDRRKMQRWKFKLTTKSYNAVCLLMEPERSIENYEACLRTPAGKFLPGGYRTNSNPKWMIKKRGFDSAAELIRWWSKTSRTRWAGRKIPRFKRFMAWVYYNRSTKELHYWDVNGVHYTSVNYEDIRNTGNQLPPP